MHLFSFSLLVMRTNERRRRGATGCHAVDVAARTVCDGEFQCHNLDDVIM
jgi:hypothetical protein